MSSMQDMQLNDLFKIRKKITLKQCKSRHKYVTWYYEQDDLIKSGCVLCQSDVVHIRWSWLTDDYKTLMMRSMTTLDDYKVRQAACK